VGLQDYGFRAVVSARFGDIFRNNALKGGLLPVQVDAEVVEALMALVEARPARR
jgi:3-isopropylmalate/(R)-2-methylmalate dehydratase small subunit